MRSRRPTALLTSHFGAVPDVDEAFDRAVGADPRVGRRRPTGRSDDDLDASEDAVYAALERLARTEFETDAHRPFEEQRYDALGSIRMNAAGARAVLAQALGARGRERGSAQRGEPLRRVERRRVVPHHLAELRGRLLAAGPRVRGCRRARTTAAACSPRATSVTRLGARQERQRLGVTLPGRPAPTPPRSPPRPSPRSAPFDRAAPRRRAGRPPSGRPSPRRQSAIRWFWSARPVIRL